MSKNIVTKVGRELAGYQALKAHLMLEYDELDPQVLLDTLEGETELNEAIMVVAEEVREVESLQAGLDATIANLQARKAGHKKNIETLRQVILSAMDKAGIKTIKGPCVTLTRRDTPAGLRIDDEAKIPSKFFVAQDPKLDRKALKAAIDELGPEDAPIPGAGLGNGGISLTMKVK